MKRLLTVAAVVLLAVPAFAQDDIILTGADIDSLLGGGGGGGRGGNRGGRGGNNGAPDPAMMYDQLKDLLKTKKVPLEKSQEKPLQTLLNNESKAIQAFIEEQFGNRGDNRGNRGNNNFMVQIDSVITKHNAELLAEIRPLLTPDQLALLDKAEKDKKACTVVLDVLNPQQFNNNNNQNFPQELANRPRCTSQNSSTAQRVAVLGDMLNKGKKPLTADQQVKVTSLVEARFPLIQEEMRASGLPVDQLFNQNRNNNNQGQPNPQQLTNNIVNTIMSQLGVPNNNNNNQNRGNRGNQGNQNNPNQAGNFENRGGNRGGQPNQQGQQGQQGNRGNNFNPQQEIQRRTDEILDKVIVSLKPDQQPVVKKFKYDIIKQRGPLDRVRAILEEEGTPMTPEQATTVQALFNSQNQAIRNFAQQLVQTEVEALPPSAFQPVPQQNQNQNQGRNNNNNQNNVNQNPAAQQIVSKVLPQVSVRKALLEKATIDSIMKVLTPAQVASYKLNSL
jgi:hypothetical protein